MKTKLLFLCAALFAVNVATAQIYVFENFDYDTTTSADVIGKANPITGTSWFSRQGSANADALVTENPAGWSLDQAFDLNPTGKSLSLAGGGDDPFLLFENVDGSTQSVSGEGTEIYLSFLLDVVGYPIGNTVSNYRYINLAINDSGNSGEGLLIGPGSAEGKFKIGLMNSDKTTNEGADYVWHTTEYDHTIIADPQETPTYANQFFIVIKYTIGNASSDPVNYGIGEMWVNPTISTTPGTPDVVHQVSASSTRHRTSFYGVMLEGSSNARTPVSYVDEIRVTGSWNEAVGLQAAASVNDNALNAALSVYPNPSTGTLNVSTNNISVKQVQLLDLTGKSIYSSPTTNTIDTSRMAKGLYLLKITSDDGATASRKVVVQ